MKKLRWGIAGPGIIARKFAEAVKNTECAALVAVASGTAGKAAAFAAEFEIEKYYDSYEDMAADKDIDAVYVSTAHPFHRPCAEVFIRGGKHILCEKPMCVNAEDAKKLKALADENGVFLMEAMWSAFLPAVRGALEAVRRGDIGEPMGMSADFCYSIETEEDPKLFEEGLCGGSLLDVGVYCLWLSYTLFGKPESVSAFSNVCNGVDLHTQAILEYKGGKIATVSSAIKLEKPFDAYIYGEKGRIYLPFFYKADSYKICLNDGSVEERKHPYGDNGFEFEIKEACRCINEGLTESGIHPLSDTVSVLEISDKIKKLIGLRF